MPASGPTRQEVLAPPPASETSVIQVVELDRAVASRLASRPPEGGFAAFASTAPRSLRLASGDSIEVAIWEAPPATLFAASSLDFRAGPQGARPTLIPEQMIDESGAITVPFAGRIPAAGRSPHDIEREITRRLVGKANAPEVIVRVTRQQSATVTVVGEFAANVRMPVTPGGETLLDAVAAASGVRHPVGKMTIQVTRGPQVHAMPLDAIIRDPRNNIRLAPGDVVTALFQPLSVTVLGATGKNEEIAFESQGITLAQALARAGGMQDARADPRGVFVFRFERAQALDWPRQPVSVTPDGLVPVVYRLDLNHPSSFFVMQNFTISNRDVLYVSSAPAAELQKVLNLVFSIAYPVLSAAQLTR